MPADDAYSVVHEKTKDTAHYGCKDRVMSKGYWAPDRKYFAGVYKEVKTFIPHTLSTKCRSRHMWDTDPKCQGCKAEKDYERAEYMAQMK